MTIPLILEVAISMVFLYLFGSQVVLSIYELWAGYTNSRGKFLYRKLKGTIGDATAQALYNQSPIAALSPASQATPSTQSGIKQHLGVDNSSFWDWWLGFDGLPAYIPTDLFASTLLAMVAPNTTTKADITKALTVAGTTNSNWLSKEILDLLYKLLAGLSNTADLATCQKSVALWYDAYGERLTGWYKRQVRVWLFLIGLVVASVGNIDSPFIIRYLWRHPQLSQQLADAGGKEAQAAGAATTYAKPIGASFTKRFAADTAKNKVTRAITLSAKAALDSLAAKLRMSEDRVNAFNSRLHGLGFPIGRTDSASLDSSLLPSPFFVRQPARVVRQGKFAEAIPAYYLCYERHRDPAISASVKGIKSQKVYWVKEPLSIGSVTEAELLGPHDRSQASAWYEPFFGPQSQSAGQTFLGWLLTAIALSVGAPFWFDLLCRLVNIRNLGIKPPRTGQ